jgi:predicted nucleotide-binding protein
MENIIRELQDISRHCSQAEAEFDQPRIKRIVDGLMNAIDRVARSWSQSWLGYQAYVYYEGFRTPPPGNHFSSEWGFTETFSNPTSDGWREYTHEQVYNEILELSGNPDLTAFDEFAKSADERFERYKSEFITTIEVVLSDHDDKFLAQKRKEVDTVKTFSQNEMIKAHMPIGQIMSRDSLALSQGLKAPPHIAIECMLYSQVSPKLAFKKLATLADANVSYMQKKFKAPKVKMTTKSKVFIGHGNSNVWRDLKDFLQDRLHLDWDEFNREPAAGYPTTKRITQMLDNAKFAFIVMTSEDEHTDKTMHARENAIHESGLFQGRLGFEKAIILLEEGCSEFSNIVGLTQIRFPKGHVDAKFEEIRRVLEREHVI